MRYKDLRLHTRQTCRKIREACPGVALPDLAKMVQQARNTAWSTTFRRGAVGDWKTTFEPHHKELATELLSPVMKRLGYGD